MCFISANFVSTPLPQCVLLSHSVCSSDLLGQYTWRAPSDNTINDVHEHPEACDWVSKVEIDPISRRTSPNLVNGDTTIIIILGTRVLAALVGHLVGLWGCVPSHPGEPPFTPLHVHCRRSRVVPTIDNAHFCTRPYTALYVVTPWTVLVSACSPPSLQLFPQCCNVTQVYRV